jgi:hypothetical protein
MHSYLTTEADLNFPVPNAEGVVSHVRRLYDGRTPVSAQSLARLFGVSENAILPVLRRAEVTGMIRKVQQQGWIPLKT